MSRDLHTIAQHATEAFRRAHPSRFVRHLHDGISNGVRDEPGLLIAIGLLLDIACEQSEPSADIVLYTTATTLTVTVDATCETSTIGLLDLQISRQIFGRHRGEVEVVATESQLTLRASVPRRTAASSFRPSATLAW